MKGTKYKSLRINYCMLILLLINKINSLKIQTNISDMVIQGNRKFLSDLKKGIDIYLGIRYAEPPVGKLRFADPIPAQDLLLGMDKFPPSCPQNGFPPFKEYPAVDVFRIFSNISEDCLYLNIWKPNDLNVPKPVIVFIHGGGFEFGSTSVPLYEGTHLAVLTDAVVVTIQYRLGVFGFLYTGDDFAPGNAGLKDQVLALKWIRKHIQYFGGNNQMITIIGESAGSASVGYHVLSPETSKLFERAVLLSGVPNRVWSSIPSYKAKQRSHILTSKLGANKTNFREHLTSVNFNDILEVQGNMVTGDFFNLIFRPTIVPPLITDDPSQMFKNVKHLKGKELIVSWTKNEGTFFIAIEGKQMNLIDTPRETPHLSVKDVINMASFIGEKVDSLARLYGVSSDDSNQLEAAIEIYNDVLMKCSINEFIDEMRKHEAVVYHMEYDFKAKGLNQWPDWIGVEHAADLSALFGYAFRFKKDFTSHEQQIYKSYLDRLKNFIRTGNPNILGQKSWYHDQMFIFSDMNKQGDNRTDMCEKLKNLQKPYFSRNSGMQLNIFGILLHAVMAVVLV